MTAGWADVPVVIGHRFAFDTSTFFGEEGLDTCLVICVTGDCAILDSEGKVSSDEAVKGVAAFVVAGPVRPFLAALTSFIDRNPEVL